VRVYPIPTVYCPALGQVKDGPAVVNAPYELVLLDSLLATRMTGELPPTNSHLSVFEDPELYRNLQAYVGVPTLSVRVNSIESLGEEGKAVPYPPLLVAIPVSLTEPVFVITLNVIA
jgi:hypothetical protein